MAAQSKVRRDDVPPGMHPSTVLIGLDAFERTRLESLMNAGRLPNLAGIVNRGGIGALGPRPAGFHAMPWPSFLHGRSTVDHGWYAAKRWNPSSMRLEATVPDDVPPSAFWDRLDDHRYRIALLDVPFAPRPQPDFSGVCVQGWQNHDQMERYAHPAGLWRDLRAKFGAPIIRRELCAPHRLDQLRAVRDDVLAATEQFGEICVSVLKQEPWDLFLAVLGAPHRIGHYLWDTAQAVESHVDEAGSTDLDDALDDVYCRCDETLGRILDAAPRDSRVAVFSLHGMRQETGWCEVLPRLLAQIDGIGAPALGTGGALYSLKKAVHTPAVEKLLWHLPYGIYETIVPLWSRSMHDWDQVRCFALPGGDSNGLIRINLKGREARGTVAPGAEYEELCDAIEAGLRSFSDIETGAPVVARIDRMDRLGRAYDRPHSAVPDIVVDWAPISAYRTRGVDSAQHGRVEWQPNWRAKTGRSGDHSGRGWLASEGPGLPPNARTEDIAELGNEFLRWVTGAPA